MIIAVKIWGEKEAINASSCNQEVSVKDTTFKLYLREDEHSFDRMDGKEYLRQKE